MKFHKEFIPGPRQLADAFKSMWGFWLFFAIVAALCWFAPRVQPPKYGDPYECFGAGRYEAMSRGNVCPGWENK